MAGVFVHLRPATLGRRLGRDMPCDHRHVLELYLSNAAARHSPAQLGATVTEDVGQVQSCADGENLPKEGQTATHVGTGSLWYSVVGDADPTTPSALLSTLVYPPSYPACLPFAER